MNQYAFDLVTKFEGCKLQAYQDDVGVWTIGWGHTGADVNQSLSWTQAQADAQLGSDLNKAEQQVRTMVHSAIGVQSFGALTSFTYNLGSGTLQRSSVLLPSINNSRHIDAAKAFLAFDRSGTTESKGLLRRRLLEASTYLEGV